MLKKTVNNKPRTSFNPFLENGIDGTYTIQETVTEAVVVDVIVNDKHPQYAADGYNVGAIKFRALKNHMFRNDGDLHWALPIEANLTEYPLLNEIVHIVASLNRFYYTRKINVSSTVTSQSIPGLNKELAPLQSSKERAGSFQKTVGTPVKVETTPDALGKFYKAPTGVYRLRHDEGDMVLEGRSGQSIRMGAAWKTGTNFQSSTADQQPNLLFRIGPGAIKPSVSGEFGLVTEDINLDKSSIYLVSDQIVPLKLATAPSKTHLVSVSDFPMRLDGNQIIINSDRFIVNAKTDRIAGFAKKGIHWVSGKDFTVDCEANYLSTINGNSQIKINQNRTTSVVGKSTTTIGDSQTTDIKKNSVMMIGGYFKATASDRYSVVSPKVFIGTTQNEAEPIPLGATLAAFLSAFLDAHLEGAGTYVMTSVGPGILSPGVVANLVKLKSDVAKGKLASFNSEVAFTTKKKE
jgi:hypothetical protein